MCSWPILKIVGNKERQLTSTEPWNDSMYEDQYSVPLPPIQVTRNKAITYSYTIWDRVSLDTGFLATAVKNLWVFLSFNAQGYSTQYQNDQQRSEGNFNNLQRNDCMWSLAEF